MIKFWVGILSFLSLTACTAPALKPFTINTFEMEAPVKLQVGDIQITSHVTTYDRLPHIEQKMPVTPEQALTRWAHNRFVAADAKNPTQLVINITDAYMTQSNVDSGHWYQLDNVRYRLTYKINIQFKRRAQTVYTQSVTGWETSALPQKSSLAAKEETWQTMMNTMLTKVNNKVLTDMPAVYKK